MNISKRISKSYGKSVILENLNSVKFSIHELMRKMYCWQNETILCYGNYRKTRILTGIATLFFLKFLADTCPFLGPLVLLFWISGDVSSGFQSQSGFCLIRYFCRGECNVRSPRSTSWQPARSWYCPHILLQRWSCRDSNSCSQNKKVLRLWWCLILVSKPEWAALFTHVMLDVFLEIYFWCYPHWALDCQHAAIPVTPQTVAIGGEFIKW